MKCKLERSGRMMVLFNNELLDSTERHPFFVILSEISVIIIVKCYSHSVFKDKQDFFSLLQRLDEAAASFSIKEGNKTLNGYNLPADFLYLLPESAPDPAEVQPTI